MALSQSLKQPLLTSLSTIIQNKKKDYYNALEAGNTSNQLDSWLRYFSQTILESQNHTQKLIEFLMSKTKLFERLRDQLNERQEKVLLRMFREGLSGFAGGFGAKNYIAITKTSQPTATRDLQDLVEKGALVRTGELKGARYFLNV